MLQERLIINLFYIFRSSKYFLGSEKDTHLHNPDLNWTILPTELRPVKQKKKSTKDAKQNLSDKKAKMDVEKRLKQLESKEQTGKHEDSDQEEKEESVASAVAILNFEWPRSETIRRRGLESSSAELPCSLVMFVGREKRKVVGHAKVSKVPALPGELFVESVVIHPSLRGIGLGKLLMLKVSYKVLLPHEV